MSENVILILVSLFFGLMPLWMGYVVNPRWAAKTQKIIIAVLLAMNVLFYGFLFFASSIGSFKDMLSSSAALILLFVFGGILLSRAYQLWPR